MLLKMVLRILIKGITTHCELQQATLSAIEQYNEFPNELFPKVNQSTLKRRLLSILCK